MSAKTYRTAPMKEKMARSKFHATSERLRLKGFRLAIKIGPK